VVKNVSTPPFRSIPTYLVYEAVNYSEGNTT
jgi:hypothetical protein